MSVEAIIFNMSQPQSVAGIIFQKNQTEIILIKRRDVPVWVLPGGGIDAGETSKDAIMREILEETGFTVKVNRLVGHYTPINRLAKHTHFFECEIISGTPKITDETRDIQSFQVTALPKLPPPYIDWIKDALLDSPPVKKKIDSVNYTTLIKYFICHPLLVIRFLLARAGMPINTK